MEEAAMMTFMVVITLKAEETKETYCGVAVVKMSFLEIMGRSSDSEPT
jgi:hypothetical protein